MFFLISEIKVMLEFIPNHTSDDHEWFQASCNKLEGKDDYYVWRNESSINNWVRVVYYL